jgi:hypothetical protein
MQNFSFKLKRMTRHSVPFPGLLPDRDSLEDPLNEATLHSYENEPK